MKVDDAFPLEARVVSNLIEQSQHRVEGANFDMRKHLLEYDDVLNQQRTQIYGQRDRIFVKEDLREDVQEMLEAEIRERVEAAFEDEENFWRLPAWLEQVQPTLSLGERELFPSFPIKLIMDEFASGADPKAAAVQLANRTLTIAHNHLQSAIETAVDRAKESLKNQTEERKDLLDEFFNGLRDAEEKPRPQQALEELQTVVRLAIKLDNNQLRALVNDPESVEEEIRELVTDQLTDLAVARLVGAVENRLGESLGFSKDDLAEMAWEELTDEVTLRSHSALTRQRERFAGADGILARDANFLLQREDLASDSSRARFLLALSQGQRNVFDQRTHRQVKQVYQRFSYSFLAAELMQKMSAEDLIEQILAHLEEAEDALTLAWGRDELVRRGEPAEGQDEAASELGFRLLNEAHRRLLLSAITELWVDYLTRVEALRVSIGLEAYAQRDPLVQYKSRASEMYQGLLEDIRGTVIGRLFAIQRRPNLEILDEAVTDSDESNPAAQAQPSGKKKRKRH
jgi:preprotein translocase subunit SecA